MQTSNQSIALIPARAGSKRLPGKNIRLLGGIPLIAHSINFARNSPQISEVFVSTDSDEIANVANAYHAKVLMRPAKLAKDTSLTSEVLSYHTNKTFINIPGIKWIVLLQPTNPIRPDNLTSKAFKLLNHDGGSPALATFTAFHKKLGKIHNGKFFPENYKPGQRSQDLEKLYYENGLLYILNLELAQRGNIFPEALIPMVIDTIHGTVDIDTRNDFEYAEQVYEILNKKKLSK